MKQITFSDKQFYDLLQFTSQYVDDIIDKSVEYDDDLIIEENEEIIDIHDFICECKHKRLTFVDDRLLRCSWVLLTLFVDVALQSSFPKKTFVKVAG